MTTTLTPLGAEVASPVPTRPDGSLHRYELLYAGHTRRVYADTEAALIEVLIPGYQDLTEQHRWEARLAYATRAQVIAQAGLNTAEVFGSLSLAERTILSGPRHQPPVVSTWDCPIPLILIASYYAPAGPNARPVRAQGMAPNVIWLDPSDDETFLRSLHDIAVISLHTSDIQ